ncbi:MAG TPA: hypothetical protein VF493_22065 [Terriglobales bacterium]
MRDIVDSRILGAFRLADAVTGATVQRPLAVYAGPDFERLLSAPGNLHAVQNRSGIYVMTTAPGMDRLTQTFDVTGFTPLQPVVFTIKISDPQGFYLPRLATVTLPRDTSLPPGGATSLPPTDTGNVFQAQPITLYPAPALRGRATSASVFVRVTAQGIPNKGVPWVLIQAQTPSDSTVLASSFTDKRGEGQLSMAVPGIRANTAGGASVVAVGRDVNIVAIYDPTFAQKDASFVPDPDDLLHRASDASMKRATSQTITVQAGQAKSIAITIAIA